MVSDDTIRVTAQLIDTVTGSHLWSRTYDREFRETMERYMADPSSGVEPIDAGRVEQYIYNVLRGLQNAHFQYRSGLLPRVQWRIYAGGHRWLGAPAVIEHCWQNLRGLYEREDPEFVVWFEQFLSVSERTG